MAGATAQDVASSPRDNPADHGSAQKSKGKRKKDKKSKKPKQGEVAVLAHADQGATQPVQPKTGNKDEAERIRQRLGIKSEDVKSSQTRVGFQFSFSVAEGPPDTDALPDADADMQTNIVASTVSAETDHPPDQAISQSHATEPAAQKEPPATDAKAQPLLQADESGFIPQRVYIGGMPFWYTEDEIRQCWTECGEIADLTMLTFPDSGNFRGIVFITFATQEGFEAALSFDGDELDGKRLVVKRCKAPVPAPGADHRDGRTRGRTHEGRAGAQHGRRPEAEGDGQGGAAGQKRGRSGSTVGRRDANGGLATGQGDEGGQGSKKARKTHDGPPGRVKGYNVLFVGNIPWELSRGAVTELFEDFHPKLVRMFDKPGTRQHKGFAHVHFEDEEAVDKAMSMNGASVMGRRLTVMYAQPSKKQSSKPSKKPSENKDVIEEGI